MEFSVFSHKKDEHYWWWFLFSLYTFRYCTYLHLFYLCMLSCRCTMGKHCQYVNSTILFAMLELNNDNRLGQRYDLIVNSGIHLGESWTHHLCLGVTVFLQKLTVYYSLVGPMTFCLGQVKFDPTTISKIEGWYGDKNVFFLYRGSGKLTWNQLFYLIKY